MSVARSGAAVQRDKPTATAMAEDAGALPRPWVMAATLSACAFAFAFVNLWQDWYADPYFAATVQSMRTGWHNFFYLSFDPVGFVSVDKPPLALWLQTACTELLGFRTFSLLLPATLAGLGSIALLAHLVRRAAGSAAGLLAALFLLLTPVAVATNRSNNMDSLTAFSALLGAWAVLRAAESGRLRPLLLCAVALGLGFNAKLLQAFVVVPCFVLLYMAVPAVPMRTRLARLALASVVGLALSFAWVAAVDHTAAAKRPYVGSSSNNTVADLVFGYDGLSRLLPGSTVSNAYTASVGADPGDPGLLRLLDEQAGGQIGWLLPLALLGLVAAVRAVVASPVPEPRARGRRTPAPSAARGPLLLRREAQAVLLWGGWMISLVLLYSVSSYFHPYNLVMLAPAVSAMAAIGLISLWRAYRGNDSGWWLLPTTLAVTGLVQAAIVLESPDWNRWVLALVLGGSCGAAAWLVLARSGTRRGTGRELVASVVGTAALLVAPALWASVPVWHYGNAEFPIAGPDLLNPAVEAPAQTRAFLAPPSLTRYLLAHRGRARYILGARYGSIAAPVMLATGQAVLTYGGYLGVDHIQSVPQLAALVWQEQVRFFWTLNAQAEQAHVNDIEGWVVSHCGLVPAARWLPPGQYGPKGPRLFDCGTGA